MNMNAKGRYGQKGVGVRQEKTGWGLFRNFLLMSAMPMPCLAEKDIHKCVVKPVQCSLMTN